MIFVEDACTNYFWIEGYSRPLNPGENSLSNTVVLRPFVPAFRGVMKVQVREKVDGYIELIGHPPPELSIRGAAGSAGGGGGLSRLPDADGSMCVGFSN